MPEIYLNYGEIAYLRKICKNDQLSRTAMILDMKLEAYETATEAVRREKR